MTSNSNNKDKRRKIISLKSLRGYAKNCLKSELLQGELRAHLKEIYRISTRDLEQLGIICED